MIDEINLLSVTGKFESFEENVQGSAPTPISGTYPTRGIRYILVMGLPVRADVYVLLATLA